MKRFFVRVSLLSAVVVGGFLTITEAQKALRVAQAKAPEAAAADEYASADEGAPASGQYAAERPYPAEEPTRLAANPFDEPPAAPREAAYPDSEPPAQFMPAPDAQALAEGPPEEVSGEAGYAPRERAEEYREPAPPFDEPAQPAEFEQPAADGEPTPAEAPAFPRAPDAEPTPAAPFADESDPAAAEPATGDPNAPFAPAADEAFAAQPSTGDVPAGPEGTGKPGDARLDGPQSPLVTVHKVAPAEVQVGRPAKFQIVIRNSGSVAVNDVVLRDEVPQGTQLVAADPAPQRDPDGQLRWSLGNLSPGAEATVEMELLPLAEGEIGSVAYVSFATAASVRTVATRPALAVDITGPSEVMIDQPVALTIKISNTGTGEANGVFLTKNLPPGLRHPAGDALEYEIGTLKPGETREMQLTLTAAAAGTINSLVTAQADGGLQAQGSCDFQIIAPALEVAVVGPARRYLDKPAVYTVSVSNPGTAKAEGIELVTYLPRGLKFVEADNFGEYDPQTGAVHWMLEELPAKEAGEVKLTALPTEAGEHTLRTTASAKPNLADEAVQQVVVEGVAAVQFEVVNVEDPIEAGGETTYEIRVVNQGSKAATNVRLVALLPPELKPLAAEGPSRNRIEGQRVLFEGLPQLAPKADTTYRVRVSAQSAGDARVRVQVLTDDMQTPVTKEESTQVFSAE